MRGQEITPWSIYNQTIRPLEDKPPQQTKQTIRFPRIEKPLINHPPEHKQLTTSRRRHSALIASQNQPEKKQFTPFTSQFPDKLEVKQAEIIEKQQQIERVFQSCVALRLLREELKREISELDFLRILQNEQAEEEPLPALEIMKKEKSFLLDRHAFPRVVERNMMLVNFKEEGLNGKDLSHETIKRMLKKEISSMISNRMKIMGRAKEINTKP